MPQPPAFLATLEASPTLDRFCEQLTAHRHVAVTGQWGSCAVILAALVQRRLDRPILLLTAHLDEADEVLAQLEFLAPDRLTRLFPAYEVLPGESNLSHELAAQRLELLSELATPGAKPARRPDFLVAPVQALMQPCPDETLLKEELKTFRPGEQVDREKLIQWLIDHGYTRLEAVEDAGDFAVRGEILDVWPPGEAHPRRLDFFADQLESLHTFDLETLGTTGDVPFVRLAALGDKATWPTERTTSLFSYLAKTSIPWLIEPSEIQEQARSYYERLPDARGIYSPQAILQNCQKFSWAELHQFGHDQDAIKLPCLSLERFDTKPDTALEELVKLAGAHDVVVVCDNKSEVTRLIDLLEVKHPGSVELFQMPIGSLTMGFQWNQAQDSGNSNARSLILVGHHEIFHRYQQRRRLRSVQGARPIDSFLDLQEGDYVVHVHHGIAKYLRMSSITQEGKSSEFLTLQFAGETTLQVPVTQIHLVQKYVGGASGRPTLSVFGSNSWSKQKEKVAEAIQKMAGELLEVQAAREHSPGIAYPADTLWMKEFEAAFPYPPTEDQIRCSEDLKIDMAKPRPMDRLLCGDVGYGKTELAMRAMFKAAEFGKQVAVLVPTTILAEQHEQTFRARMAGYPFIVESISRFKTNAQVKKILERTRMGQVDILIGTHRLLSKDVEFTDLGLVVIDEEQRFGVEHKERLKRLRLTTDVLTLTATPIPRTLHMSMLGIRDISNLATPPQDRRSVVTEVIPHDKPRIKQALERELARNGQVYFVHNRIWNIQSIADEIRLMVPNARIGIGHGQMDENELENVMHKFINHEIDILVSTTIIETGLDIANANTMFIHQAENFGLSDLHQLRGRVGRYKHRAYCYLILSPDKTISSTAAKRLKAMEEYASLGAGFKIALRDLEIRGAGNILGSEQSGHISAIGYELYCQLLEEAVKKIQNQPIEKPKEVHVEIGISGMLPKTYIQGDRQRMDVYRRLSRVHKLDALEALIKDVSDAFGPPPKAVVNLFAVAELRVLAQEWGIVSIIARDPDVVLNLEDFSRLGPLLGKGPGSVRVVDQKTVHVRLPKPYFEPETLLAVLKNLLNPKAVAPPPVAAPKAPPAKPVAPPRRR